MRYLYIYIMGLAVGFAGLLLAGLIVSLQNGYQVTIYTNTIGEARIEVVLLAIVVFLGLCSIIHALRAISRQ